MDKKNTNFIFRQISEICKGGLPLLFRKLSFLFGKLYEIPLLMLAVPVVLLVWVLRPLVLIRFGPIRSERIGHFAISPEVYLCQRDIGIEEQRTYDIFYHSSPISNQQLKRMWDRTLHIFPFGNLGRQVSRLIRWLPGGRPHFIPMPFDRDFQKFFSQTKAHLSFTTKEEKRGQDELRKLGVPDGDPFVCFYVRDSVYLKTLWPERKWDYHAYRNSSVQNHILAAEELARRGYFVIRIGAVVNEPLNTANPRIIDYAVKGRSDFSDIYLCANCRFFLGSGGGMAAVASIFRKPVVLPNMTPLRYVPYGPQDMFIPKKLWLRDERRFLTFREILDSGAGEFLDTAQYERLGIEVIENTPEEITVLLAEMDERLKGTYQTAEEDEELQRRFWSLFQPNELHRVFVSRVGSEFLRQNRDLLEQNKSLAGKRV